jgi:hypothetical protein
MGRQSGPVRGFQIRIAPLDRPSVRGVAQPGSAPVLGTGGRKFESSRPDHIIEVLKARLGFQDIPSKERVAIAARLCISRPVILGFRTPHTGAIDLQPPATWCHRWYESGQLIMSNPYIWCCTGAHIPKSGPRDLAFLVPTDRKTTPGLLGRVSSLPFGQSGSGVVDGAIAAATN